MGVLALTWVALAAGAAGLLVATATRARPAGAPPDAGEYLRRWSRTHGGFDAAGHRVVGGWLAVVRGLAAPLAARGVPPGAVTGWALWSAAASAAVAAPGGRWPLAAAVLVACSGVLDSLDGAVAVLADRVTRLGFVVDSLADRLADSAYVAALWLLGAPGWLCVVGGGLAAMQEYTRARAAGAGMDRIGAVTVWERPGRVLATAFTLLGAGAVPASAGPAAIVGAAVWAALGAVGSVQVLASVRAELSS